MIQQLQPLTPRRRLTRSEALAVAETQAQRLRQLVDTATPAVTDHQLRSIPGIRIETIKGLTVSGATRKVGNTWIILIAADEPAVRQRFTICHEIKHILDDPATRHNAIRPDWFTERICDYFAACFLMPRPQMKRAWVSGLQSAIDIATLFNVSVDAARIRLQQIGLTERTQRCQAQTPNVIPLHPRVAA